MLHEAALHRSASWDSSRHSFSQLMHCTGGTSPATLPALPADMLMASVFLFDTFVLCKPSGPCKIAHALGLQQPASCSWSSLQTAQAHNPQDFRPCAQELQQANPTNGHLQHYDTESTLPSDAGERVPGELAIDSPLNTGGDHNLNTQDSILASGDRSRVVTGQSAGGGSALGTQSTLGELPRGYAGGRPGQGAPSGYTVSRMCVHRWDAPLACCAVSVGMLASQRVPGCCTV